MRKPTEEEVEAMTPEVVRIYGNTIDRMKTIVTAVLEEYPMSERVLACNTLVGIATGVMSVGIGLAEDEHERFHAELQAVVFRWLALGMERKPERFAGGLAEPLKRPEGS